MGIPLSEMAEPVDRVTSLLKLSTLSGGTKDHAGIMDLFRELNRALEEQPNDATVNTTSGKGPHGLSRLMQRFCSNEHLGNCPLAGGARRRRPAAGMQECRPALSGARALCCTAAGGRAAEQNSWFADI